MKRRIFISFPPAMITTKPSFLSGNAKLSGNAVPRTETVNSNS